MPIGLNLNSLVSAPKGEGRPGTQNKTGAPTISPGIVGAPVNIAAQPKVPPAVATSPQFTTTLAAGILPSILKIAPQLFLQKTTTQLARGAIGQLNESNPVVLEEAITTIGNSKVSAGGLMNYLERRTKIGEVLNELAKDWDDETKQDFAEAFRMDQSKLNVMDDIVAIAILNDPDLEEEIHIENTPETTGEDILENRTIVWQYPAPGTPLDPPYIVLVAVDQQDVAQAEEVIKSIMDQLINHKGFKIPKAAAQKLR